MPNSLSNRPENFGLHSGEDSGATTIPMIPLANPYNFGESSPKPAVVKPLRVGDVVGVNLPEGIFLWRFIKVVSIKPFSVTVSYLNAGDGYTQKQIDLLPSEIVQYDFD